MKLIYPAHQVTYQYAAEEFKRLSKEVDPELPVELCPQERDEKKVSGENSGKTLVSENSGKTFVSDNGSKTDFPEEIKFGSLADFGRPSEDLLDDFIEDIIDIDVENLHGIISGSNPRSVLMGVYKFFTMAGCRFLRPGPKGEYLPKSKLNTLKVHYRKKADYPYRGECIEGAVSLENCRDTIYWMPKVGMNLYYIEGVVPYVYFHKWYAHLGSKTQYKPGVVTDYDKLLEYVRIMEEDIVKTGLLYMALGHGWMFRKLGVKEGDPATEATSLKEEYKKYLALVNGKRELYTSRTFYTNFCFSNPEARQLLIDTLVEYVKEKPYISFLKPGLPDGRNNWCECEECRKKLPTDQYLEFLNEVEEVFKKEGFKTRLSFISYVETLRPPKDVSLRHPERFVGGSAFGWDYENGYCRKPFEGEEPPYVRNQFKAIPIALRMQWNREWKEKNPGVGFYFYEYRFYTDQYVDPGYMQISRETYRDMRDLQEIGYLGSIDDQTHRCHLPSSLPLLTRAFTLFDRDTDFDALKEDYFQSAFGPKGSVVEEYLSKVTKLFHPELMRRQYTSSDFSQGLGTKGAMENEDMTFVGNAAAKEDLKEAISLMQNFLPEIEEGEKLPDVCQARSWQYLRYHVEIYTRLAEALILLCDGKWDEAGDSYEICEQYMSEIEPEIQEAFDVYLFDRFMRKVLGFPMFPYYAKTWDEIPKRKRRSEILKESGEVEA